MWSWKTAFRIYERQLFTEALAACQKPETVRPHPKKSCVLDNFMVLLIA
jgi:hypothetical protein